MGGFLTSVSSEDDDGISAIIMVYGAIVAYLRKMHKFFTLFLLTSLFERDIMSPLYFLFFHMRYVFSLGGASFLLASFCVM